MNDKILYQDSNSILSFESLYCVGGYVTYKIFRDDELSFGEIEIR